MLGPTRKRWGGGGGGRQPTPSNYFQENTAHISVLLLFPFKPFITLVKKIIGIFIQTMDVYVGNCAREHKSTLSLAQEHVKLRCSLYMYFKQFPTIFFE